DRMKRTSARNNGPNHFIRTVYANDMDVSALQLSNLEGPFILSQRTFRMVAQPNDKVINKRVNQKCPVKNKDVGWKVLMGGCLSGIMYASDLKIVLRIWDGLRIDQPGGDHVRWRNAIFSDNGLSAMGYVSSHRQTIPRRLSGSQIPVFRAIESDGICPDDVSGKPPRYRSMPDIPNTEAVPHGDIRHRQSLNLGRRKRNARLADICRSCTTVDCAGTA